jgi:UDP-N-acetylglucosamine 4-epimerase
MNQKIRKSNILVTGGAGFIGSNLVESLLSAGNSVVCLDNFSTGKKENIKDFIGNPKFKLIEGDIRNIEDCKRSLEGIDIVFHEAALGSVPRSIKDPVTTVDVNIGGFVKMLHSSVEAGVKRFIYAASSSTYGDHEGLPKVEDKIGNPLSPYAVTKYSDEQFAAVFSVHYPIEVIGLRYFNVFGRKQDPAGSYAAVIPRFIMQLLKHERPLINGDGTVSRDFTFIDNVISANHISALTDNKSAINQVYNVACGKSTSINEMYCVIRNILGKFDPKILEIEPSYGPSRFGDIKHSLASIVKAERLLGYVPSVEVKAGLEETVKWLREHL